jgi:hypothetical protein
MKNKVKKNKHSFQNALCVFTGDKNRAQRRRRHRGIIFWS